MRRLALLAVMLINASVATAEPHTLRIATLAPDGSGWARELRAFANSVETDSGGGLRVKFYFGGVAGDEPAAEERVRRGQLDGVASGGVLCEQVMPSMRVLMVAGLFRTREESAFVLHRIEPDLEREARVGGYELLGTSGLGPVVIFARAPLSTLAELRAARLWSWGRDDQLAALGFHVVGSPMETSLKDYDEGKLDGFFAPPAAALAFGWSAHTRYLIDLRTRFLSACLLVSSRAFDRLPYSQQASLRTAMAQLDRRLEFTGRELDDHLLGGLFQKQGLTSVELSEGLRSEFFEAARAARSRLDPKQVDPALLARVSLLIADFRAGNR